MSRRSPNTALVSLLETAKQHHRTAASAVTEALRMAIINGVLPAGLPLRQDLMAADLGLSRMPIRESIRRLETEGLVDFTPHCGAVVATLRPDDIREIAQMRLSLECLALERSFAGPGHARFDEADALLVELDAADSLMARNALNRRFHGALYGINPNMRIYRHIDMLYDAYERFLVVEHSQLDRRTRSQQEHRSILQAARDRDLATARAALTVHIEGAANELVDYLNERSKIA